MKRSTSLLLFLGALTMGSTNAAQGTLQWQEEKGKSVALLKDGKPLWGFSYGPDLMKSYFHPVCTADGLWRFVVPRRQGNEELPRHRFNGLGERGQSARPR